MQKLTCDEAIMKQITLDTQDYTNNEKDMEEIANSDYSSDCSARTTAWPVQSLWCCSSSVQSSAWSSTLA